VSHNSSDENPEELTVVGSQFRSAGPRGPATKVVVVITVEELCEIEGAILDLWECGNEHIVADIRWGT